MEKLSNQNGSAPGKGKTAICALHGRVCPRFDLTHEVFILHPRSPRKRPMETVNVSFLSPAEIAQVLAREEVRVVIVGGIQECFQEMIAGNGIQVIWGVMGEIREVIRACRQGLLHPGTAAESLPPRDGD